MTAPTVLVELSNDDLTAIIFALQEQIRNESGLTTEKGIRQYQALCERLEPLWVDELEHLSPHELAAAILEAQGFASMVLSPVGQARVGFPCNDPRWS